MVLRYFCFLSSRLVMCLFAWLKLRRKGTLTLNGSYKVKKNKILEFLGKNKFPLITKSSESNTAWVLPWLGYNLCLNL
ncbi:unnamed protein product [Brassica rapa subsp. trilocularis]